MEQPRADAAAIRAIGAIRAIARWVRIDDSCGCARLTHMFYNGAQADPTRNLNLALRREQKWRDCVSLIALSPPPRPDPPMPPAHLCVVRTKPFPPRAKALHPSAPPTSADELWRWWAVTRSASSEGVHGRHGMHESRTEPGQQRSSRATAASGLFALRCSEPHDATWQPSRAARPATAGDAARRQPLLPRGSGQPITAAGLTGGQPRKMSEGSFLDLVIQESASHVGSSKPSHGSSRSLPQLQGRLLFCQGAGRLRSRDAESGTALWGGRKIPRYGESRAR